MLGEYQGAIVAISHDRAFLDGLCDHIWEVGAGAATDYAGNYSKWRAIKAMATRFVWWSTTALGRDRPCFICISISSPAAGLAGHLVRAPFLTYTQPLGSESAHRPGSFLWENQASQRREIIIDDNPDVFNILALRKALVLIEKRHTEAKPKAIETALGDTVIQSEVQFLLIR